jgi:hypothetical protein
MTRLPYDPTLRSLLRPDLAEPCGLWSLFDEGDPASMQQPLFLAECARLAYCRFESDPALLDRLRAALARAGYTRLQTFSIDKTDTQAFAAYDPRRRLAVAAFRGTQADRLRDVAVDLQIAVEPWESGGTVHSGFGAAAAGVLSPLQSWLAAEAADRVRLDLAGHSLGAALAVLAASRCAPGAVAAFGCPRVGDAEFARSVQQLAIVRYVNCCDVICRVPPECRWYTHAGTGVYIGRNGRIARDTSAAGIAADMLAARTDYLLRLWWRPGNAGARELADHSMLNYLRAFM